MTKHASFYLLFVPKKVLFLTCCMLTYSQGQLCGQVLIHFWKLCHREKYLWNLLTFTNTATLYNTRDQLHERMIPKNLQSAEASKKSFLSFFFFTDVLGPLYCMMLYRVPKLLESESDKLFICQYLCSFTKVRYLLLIMEIQI